jgi:hypothetical protein
MMSFMFWYRTGYSTITIVRGLDDVVYVLVHDGKALRHARYLARMPEILNAVPLTV